MGTGDPARQVGEPGIRRGSADYRFTRLTGTIGRITITACVHLVSLLSSPRSRLWEPVYCCSGQAIASPGLCS
jgi:hypothetical protein